MQVYFDFNKTFDETVKGFNYKSPEFEAYSRAWTQQCNVNMNHYMSPIHYKHMDNIKSLMKEYKQALINKYGENAGKQQFNDIFLKSGALNEENAIKGLYNVIRYSIAYGAAGKNIEQEFLNGEYSGKAFNDIQKAISVGLPKLPEKFINEMISEYKNTSNSFTARYQHSYHLAQTAGREAQIKFIQDAIDPMFTKSQKFRAFLSDLKTSFNQPSTPNLSGTLGEALVGTLFKTVAYTIMTPLVAIVGGVRVFGGEAAEMKMDDAIEAVGKNFTKIKGNIIDFKNDVKKLFTLEGLKEKVGSVRKTNSDSKESRFKNL